MLYLKSRRLAHWLGVTNSTIVNWVKRYNLPARRTMGGHYRFDPRRVVAFLEKRNMEVPKSLRDFAEQPDLARATPPIDRKGDTG